MSMRPIACPHCGGYHGCPPWKPEPLFEPLPPVPEDNQDNATFYEHGYLAGRSDALQRVRDLLRVLGDELVARPLPEKQPAPVCSLCNGTKRVNWGRADRVGGESGPCICTPEGQELIWGKRR
jgi:hypothetical protein